MKNIIKAISSAIILSTILTSCFEDPIDLDLNENNKKLAIEAWINTLEEDQFVKLSYTANYLGNEPYETVSGASVILKDALGEEYVLQDMGTGNYKVPDHWTPEYNTLYKLEITVGDNLYSAEHILRSAPAIEDLFYEPYFNEEDSLLGFEPVFAFQENPGKGDAYYVIDYLKNTLVGDTLLNGGYADDEFFDGLYIDDVRVSDEENLFQIGDTAVVELFSIGKETAQFLMDIELEVFRGGLFDPPPANVRTNFNGDVVGYFILSGASRKEIVIE